MLMEVHEVSILQDRAPALVEALLRECRKEKVEYKVIALESTGRVLRELKVVLKEAGGGGVPSILKEARGFSDFSAPAPTYWGGTRCLSLHDSCDSLMTA